MFKHTMFIVVCLVSFLVIGCGAGGFSNHRVVGPDGTELSHNNCRQPLPGSPFAGQQCDSYERITPEMMAYSGMGMGAGVYGRMPVIVGVPDPAIMAAAHQPLPLYSDSSQAVVQAPAANSARAEKFRQCLARQDCRHGLYADSKLRSECEGLGLCQ